MKLYHGTSSISAALIESCGYIAKDVERTYGLDSPLATTNGYVYLTTHPGYAAYMANKEALFKKADFFVVYEVDVEEEFLKADIDELRYVWDLTEDDAIKCTLTDSLEISMCCCTPQNLHVGKEVKRKVTMPFSGNYRAPLLKTSKEIICLRKKNQEASALEIMNQVGWESLLD
ncbi:hypothetical protein [Enterobacter mori]|uniref:hypothetical protein n=1 Tax=Enterobacter mori TaxID=539813 RepID=UPI0032AFA5D4